MYPYLLQYEKRTSLFARLLAGRRSTVQFLAFGATDTELVYGIMWCAYLLKPLQHLW